MERVLLLLPTSTYRAPDFLEAAKRMGIDVVVASEEPSTMERLAEGRLLTLDFLDPDESARRVAEFHERFPIRAAIPVDEATAVVAAAISKRLGLPRNDPEAALRARWKHRMREALRERSVPQPGFEIARAGDDEAALAERVRYPAVLKPAFLSGSRGVVRVDDRESFRRWFVWLRQLLSTPELRAQGGSESDVILVEEYVEGPEVALEGIARDGTLRTLAIFDKPDPLEGPWFEETIYVTPSRLSDDVQRQIESVAARAGSAIGLRQGPVHAELRLPPKGEPNVIEIAGRSIGGLCSRSLRFGVGISLEELILRHSLGKDVLSFARETRASGVMMIPIPGAGKLLEILGVEEARAVDGIEEVTMTAHIGKVLVPLPEGSSYLGFLFARGETPDFVERALREAHRRLRFRLAPT